MKLYIKLMVSVRCRLIAKDALTELGYPHSLTSIGMINLPIDLSSADRKKLSTILRSSGMLLLDKKSSTLVDKIDQVIDNILLSNKGIKPKDLPALLEEKIGETYKIIANLISEVKGVSIEHYMLLKRIEVVKEHLIYDDLNLTEIAKLVGLETGIKLSYQFKKITGLSPKFYKIVREKRFKESHDYNSLESNFESDKVSN